MWNLYTGLLHFRVYVCGVQGFRTIEEVEVQGEALRVFKVRHLGLWLRRV